MAASQHKDIAHRSRRLQRRPKQGPKPVAQPPVADQLPIGPIDGDLSLHGYVVVMVEELFITLEKVRFCS